MRANRMEKIKNYLNQKTFEYFIKNNYNFIVYNFLIPKIKKIQKFKKIKKFKKIQKNQNLKNK